MKSLDRTTTLLIVPPNDEEAFLIAEIAEKLGVRTHRSDQPHGARLEREPNLLSTIESSGCFSVVIVEMPGPGVEEQIRLMEKEVVIIDHHNYEDLERAHDEDGNTLPSSLEQFLTLFHVTDIELESLGYDPRLVRAVGYWDAGYLWGVLEHGYSREEALRVSQFVDHLAEQVGKPEVRPEVQKEAKRVLDSAENYGPFLVLQSSHPTIPVRMAVSKILALKHWRPTSIILSERGGDRLYVQETDYALELFHAFGGFTFGTDRNWGYDNSQEGDRVTLAQLKAFLSRYV